MSKTTKGTMINRTETICSHNRNWLMAVATKFLTKHQDEERQESNCGSNAQ